MLIRFANQYWTLPPDLDEPLSQGFEFWGMRGFQLAEPDHGFSPRENGTGKRNLIDFSVFSRLL